MVNTWKKRTSLSLGIQSTHDPDETIGGVAKEPTREPPGTSLLLRATLDSATGGIMAADLAGNLVYHNQEFAAVWGLPADLGGIHDLPTLAARAAPQAKDPGAFLRSTRQIHAHPEAQASDMVELKDGRFIERCVKPQRVGDSLVGCVLHVRDVTQRQRSEAAWQKSEHRFSSLFDSCRDAIMTVEPPSWKFTSGNPAAVAMFGARNEEHFLSLGPMEVSPERQPDGRPSADKAKEMIETAMREGSHFFEWTHQRINGETFPSTVLLSRVDAAGRVFLQATVRDITQSKRLEAELETFHRRALRDSERFLRSLVESLPQNILRKDLEGRFTFANDFFCRTVGRTMDQIIGKTNYDIFPPHLAEKFRRDEQQVLASGKLFEAVEENVNSAGETIYVRVIKTPLRDEENRLVGLQVIFWDVTAQRLAEIKLARERDLLATLLENVPDAIYFKDLQSRFVRCSHAFKRMFNVADLDTLKGKTDFDFFTEEHARPAYEDEQEIIRTGKPILGKQEKETHPDGRVAWALTSKMPWRDADGKIIGTFGISKDITAIKEAEARLEAAHKQLVEFSRQAGMAEVASSVLHNVGNVLNSVNTSAGVVVDLVRGSNASGISRVGALLEEHRQDLPVFLADANRAEKLITYIKTLAEHLASERTTVLAELKELTQNIEHIKEIVAMQQSYAGVCGVIDRHQVSALVEDALRMHDGGLTRHKVRVLRQFENVPEVLVDKHKVLQVLVNLISNAKYALSASAAPERTLTLSLKPAGPGLRISVTDNGVGIAPENLSRMFAHGFTTKKDGHGFGLHSAALAAQEMGGSLQAHSDGLERGASFTLELPLAPPERLAQERPRQCDEPPPSHPGPGRKALSTENQ